VKLLFSTLARLCKGKITGDSNFVNRSGTRKIGHTIPEIADLLPEQTELPRISFSIWRDQAVRDAINGLGRSQILLCGFEAHICIYQSAMDLHYAGYAVYLAADAISSRHAGDKSTALAELSAQGVHLTSVEIALFALMRDAKHPAFKAITALIK